MKRHLFATVALIGAAAPAFGHHSEAAEFDQNNPVKVTGTIVKVEWLNPHVWFYVDVKDEQGDVTTWGFSAAPPGALMRRGITKASIPIGAELVIRGYGTRDGSNKAVGREMKFADGRELFFGGTAAPGENTGAPQ